MDYRLESETMLGKRILQLLRIDEPSVILLQVLRDGSISIRIAKEEQPVGGGKPKL